MTDQAILLLVGTGYFSLTFCFIDGAIHINALLMFLPTLLKSHESFRQSSEGPNMCLKLIVVYILQVREKINKKTLRTEKLLVVRII